MTSVENNSIYTWYLFIYHVIPVVNGSVIRLISTLTDGNTWYFYFWFFRVFKIKKDRHHWVRPINGERHTSEHYVQLYKKLRQDPAQLFNYFRTNISPFDELLSYGINQYKCFTSNFRFHYVRT